MKGTVNILKDDRNIQNGVVAGKQTPAISVELSYIGEIKAIKAELDKRIKNIEDLRYQGQHEESTKELENTIEWYISKMSKYDDIKNENLANFEKYEIVFECEVRELETHVNSGGMTEADLNIYRPWDRKRLQFLKENGCFNYIETNLVSDILPYYDGIRSFDMDKAQSIFDAGLSLELPALDTLKEVDIEENILKKLQKLDTWGNCPKFIIKDAKILQNINDNIIDLIEECLKDGVVTKDMTNLLSYSEDELDNMIRLHKMAGITFSSDLYREELTKDFDYGHLRYIKQVFGIDFSDSDLHYIPGGSLNIKRLEMFSEFLKENPLETKIGIEKIIAISELDENTYQTFLNNLVMLKKIGIRFSFNTAFDVVDFLGNDLKTWTYTPEKGCEDAKLQNIVVWPLLEACHKERLVLPYEVYAIESGNVSKIFFALLKKDYYESPETAPQNIKQFLDIDRAGVEYLQNKGIKLGLQFFVQEDEKTKISQPLTFHSRNNPINRDNFDLINNRYSLVSVPQQVMEHIQEGYLKYKDAMLILGAYLKKRNVDLDKYWKPDMERSCCSLDRAIEIMDQCVADYYQQ